MMFRKLIEQKNWGGDCIVSKPGKLEYKNGITYTSKDFHQERIITKTLQQVW